MKKDYVLGLDLGINNVGWSIIDINDKKIEKAGVRLYSPASGAADRREARSVRRRKKRERTRIEDLLKLFNEIDFPNINTVDSKLLLKRIDGLNSKIDKQDIVNICCYFVTHRGYISFDDEKPKVVELNGAYPCQYYKKLLDENNKYRALDEVVSTNDLKNELIDIINYQIKYYPELKRINNKIINIFTRKRKYWEGPGSIYSLSPYGRFSTPEEVIEYEEMKKQGKEKYLYEKLLNTCDIFIDEKVTCQNNYYYEKFKLLNDFINIKINDIDDSCNQNYFKLLKNGDYKLTTDALNKITELCKENVSIKYDSILKSLGISKKNISGFRIDKSGKPEFSTMNNFRTVKKIVDSFENASTEIYKNLDVYNRLMYIFSVVPNFDEAKNAILTDYITIDKFDENDFECLKKVYEKVKIDTRWCKYSEHALSEITKKMQKECLNFNHIYDKYDYQKYKREYYLKLYNDKNSKLLKMNSKTIDNLVASPQVKKTLRQSINIINAVIEEKGYYPNTICVETTRELYTKEKAKEYDKNNEYNEKLRKNAIKYLEETFGSDSVNSTNIIKKLLFDEINGRCPYCNKVIEINDIVNPYIQIEHILPISKSGDNSYENKTLSCQKCNSDKGNKTPYQWMNSELFSFFEERINKLKISDKKKENFLNQKNLDKYSAGFINRNLRDTAYATNELIKQIRNFNWILNDRGERSILTLATPGELTGIVRKRTRTGKNRQIGKFHHAVDASIIGLFSLTKLGSKILRFQNDIQYLFMNLTDIQKDLDKNEIFKNLYLEEIKKEISKIKSDDDINLSYTTDKDYSKSISNANIKKYIKKENNFYKIDQIDSIYDSKILENKKMKSMMEENLNYHLLIQDNDKELYELILNIWNDKKYNNGKDNPFIEYCCEINNITAKEFDYLKHGIKLGDRPIVNKLRYYEKTNNPLLLNNSKVNKKDNTYIGLDSISQYCTRVFYDKDNKEFIFIPIYITSVKKTNEKDPVTGKNRVKINKKDKTYKYYEDKYLKGKNYVYVSDLFNGSCIKIKKKDGYITDFVSCYHKTVNVIMLKNEKCFTKSDKELTIYDVDVLGNKKERLTWIVK